MHIFSAIFLTFLSFQVHALQVHDSRQQTFLNGFDESFSGETITYHSPDPRAETALIVRSADSTRMISWYTEKVPEGINGDSISFVWLFGMDAAASQQEFILRAEGKELVKFRNPATAELGETKIKGKYGSSLSFRTTMIDRHKDVMGYAVLTLPLQTISPGKRLLLQVNGRSEGSNIWYMTFQLPVEERIETRSLPLLLQEEGKRFQSVLIELVNLSAVKDLTVSGNDLPKKTFQIQPGYNSFQYPIPEVTEKRELTLYFRMNDGMEDKRTLSVVPVRPRTIYLVQHTHTDIGYTRPQSEILPEHLRFIDYALDYCDQTDHFPEDSKFRWTCESSWIVDQYIRRRPEKQIKRLLERTREGRIEVTAMPFNLSEIADEQALKFMLHPVRSITGRGIPVVTAMQDDVNGIGWCLADYLPEMGVRYLIMGEHGHRALIPFDKPTAFWWASPSGKKMLAFRGEHYMYGNFLLLHTGDLKGFRDNLLRYLEQLDEKKYPFDRVSLQYSGYVTDNSPPSIVPNKLIREWNEKYVWPKLRSATAGEYMEYIEKHHGAELEVIGKSWPDWWTDGFGSAARETAAVREAQTEMNITTGLFSMAEVLGTEVRPEVHQRIRDIYDQIILYDEHTFGAAESITSPNAENTMDQWAEKSAYAWNALKKGRILKEEALGLLQEHLPRFEDPSISVFNTLNWSRSGPVEIYIDHEIIEPGQPFTIFDQDGNEVPVQPVASRSDGTTWVLWAGEVPAFGYRTYRISRENGPESEIRRQTFTGQYTNSFYTVNIDPETGGFSSLKYTGNGREMADKSATWDPGQLIYERLSDRHQLERFTLEEEPRRSGPDKIRFGNLVEGPVYTSISLTGQLPECAEGAVEMQYRFYKNQPLIELLYRINKKAVSEPEALYVAFPINSEAGSLSFDVPGGLVRPGIDQLAGTASDWNTVQHFVSVAQEDGQWLISSPEIPLFQLGGLNIGNFDYVHDPPSGHVYSWVMNNYWTTNFRATQEGEFSWRYFITCEEVKDQTSATRFGWQSMTPLTGRVLPGGSENGKKESLSLLSHDLEGLLLVNACPGPDAGTVTLHLREISGNEKVVDPVDIFIPKDGFHWRKVDALGNPVLPVSRKLRLLPNSVNFIEVRWKP